MGISDGKVIGNILVNLYGITLGIDVGTDMGYLYGSFDGSNYCKIQGLFLVVSLVYTNGKVLGYDEGIKLGLSYGKLLGTVPRNLDVITLEVDVGTELGTLDGSFDGSNDDKLEGLLLGESLGYTDDKVVGSDEGVWFSLSFTHSLTPLVGFLLVWKFSVSDVMLEKYCSE